jgi:hypothetical protein
MTTSSSTAPSRYPGRHFVALGFAVTVLGIGAYVAQVWAGYLKMPRYLPISGMLGVAFVGLALWQARSFWRWLALVLLLLVVGAEWTFLLGTGVSAYTGTQVTVGKPFPAFATVRADGTPFTQRDLEGDSDTVMVFFRGRW